MGFTNSKSGPLLRIAILSLMLALTATAVDAKDRAKVVVSPLDTTTRLVDDVHGPYTLTVYIDGMRNSVGNVDMLIFDQSEGWPDEIPYSLRKFEVPAAQGNMVLKVTNLPPGDYAVLVLHDENLNRRIDKDWRGVPIEQWGMSNNPRVYMSTPAYHRAKFHLQGDMEIHVPLKFYP